MAALPLGLLILSCVPTFDTAQPDMPVTAVGMAESVGKVWRLRSHSDIDADRLHAHEDARLSFGWLKDALVVGVFDGCNNTGAVPTKDRQAESLRFSPDGHITSSLSTFTTQVACSDDKGRPVGFAAADLLEADARWTRLPDGGLRIVTADATVVFDAPTAGPNRTPPAQ